jgi:hypothetical protein
LQILVQIDGLKLVFAWAAASNSWLGQGGAANLDSAKQENQRPERFECGRGFLPIVALHVDAR